MSQKPSKGSAGREKGEGNMEKDVREHTEEKAGCRGQAKEQRTGKRKKSSSIWAG